MNSIVAINPFRCRMWSLHDRLETHITEESCRVEIESLAKHGQLIPAIGRKLREDPDYDVELICGARRLFAARHINVPLKIELRELSARDGIIAMDIENRMRKDVSAYERGRTYARWLSEGYFQSQDELSRALKIFPSKVSRLLKVARLPMVIVEAFKTPLVIREEWAVELVTAMEDPQRKLATLQRARLMQSSDARPAPREIFKKLIDTKSRRLTRRRSDEVVKSRGGAPLFRIRRQEENVALLLPLEKMSERTVKDIRDAISTLLVEADESQRGRV